MRIWVACVRCDATTEPFFGEGNDWDCNIAAARAQGAGWGSYTVGPLRRDLCPACLRAEGAKVVESGAQLGLALQEVSRG